MEQNEFTQFIAELQMGELMALTLLTRAITKQPGIDKDKLIADLLQMLPEKAIRRDQALLVNWREVLQTNL